jgi:hypothetical protein
MKLVKKFFFKELQSHFNYMPLWRLIHDPSMSGDVEQVKLKNESYEESWRILGEQSEWILNMVKAHKKDVNISEENIIQFMHYFLNMLGLGHRAGLFTKNRKYYHTF